ncbi:hypothetical protein CK203_012602 [Vitis vinifera]|uniref:Uncharacterized protein n=1 Tax=Vitis vinifera TaxID=29760 RepID=A0A438KMT7_VITVI|nr:hypothetical protein CK203_012602 [Vitis vinifera]
MNASVRVIIDLAAALCINAEAQPRANMADQGQEGGWNSRYGGGSSRDGSWEYRWGSGSGPGGAGWASARVLAGVVVVGLVDLGSDGAVLLQVRVVLVTSDFMVATLGLARLGRWCQFQWRIRIRGWEESDRTNRWAWSWGNE